MGVVAKHPNKLEYLHSEVIRFKDKDFQLKMKDLLGKLDKICNQFQIESAAIEEGFLGKNVKSMNILAKIRGVVLASMVSHDIPLTSYSPREVKQALGIGSAPKEQVANNIKRFLNLEERKGFDESDALAVAYCHALCLR